MSDATRKGIFDELLKDIPPNPPRPVALLPGLSLKNMSGGGIWLLFGVVFFLFPLMMTIMIWVVTPERPHIKHALNAEGRVLGVRTSSNEHNSRVILYQFRTQDGHQWVGEQRCTGDTPGYVLQSNDVIQVDYESGDPAQNVIGGTIRHADNPIGVVFLFLVLMIGFFAVPYILFHRPFLAARKIFRKGVMVPGEIVFVRQKMGFEGPFFIIKPRVFYKFRTSENVEIEAKTADDNLWLLTKLDHGTPVHVVYNPTNPSQSIVLEFFVR